MGKIRVDFKEFLRRSLEHHGNQYSYDENEYVDFKTHISIMCAIHGVFKQSPGKHSSGQGCRKCYFESLKNVINYETFVKEARKVHGDRYSYPRDSYVENSPNVTIECNKHGLIERDRGKYLKGGGCQHCTLEDRKKTLTYEEFLIEARNSHGDTYTYFEEEYFGRTEKTKIECAIHGEFYQTPINHIRDEIGCVKCKRSITAEKRRLIKIDQFSPEKLKEFVPKAVLKKIQLECVRHGEFEVTPKQIPRCSKCWKVAIRDKTIEKWFNYKNFKFEKNWLPTDVENNGLVFLVSDFDTLVSSEEISESLKEWATNNSFTVIIVQSEVYESLSPLIDAKRSKTIPIAKNKKPSSKIASDHTCSEGHKWSVKSKPGREPKCPYCNNRKVLCGFNDLGCLYPEIASDWSSSNVQTPHEMTQGSNTSVEWRCSSDHIWMASIASRTKGAGCRKCYLERVRNSEDSGNKKKRLLKDEFPELADEIVDKNLLETLSFSTHKIVEWRCELNHIYTLSPNNRLGKRGCPYCAGRKVLQGFNNLLAVAPHLEKELVNPLDGELPSWSRDSIDWIHFDDDGREHRWSSSPTSRVAGSKCHLCVWVVVDPGVNDVATLCPNIASQWADSNTVKPTDVMRGSNEKIDFICPEGHKWWALVKDATSGKKRCNECQPKRDPFRSNGEIELFDFLSKFATVESNVRRFKKHGVYEIDCFLPNEEIAVDFNGTYWHQEKFKGKDYHKNKRTAIEGLGLSHFEVWEDKWKENRAQLEKELEELIILKQNQMSQSL